MLPPSACELVRDGINDPIAFFSAALRTAEFDGS